MKSNMFKKISAKENLIDDAQEANAAAESPDPVDKISAVDFDGEIATLLKKAGLEPQEDANIGEGEALGGQTEDPNAPPPEGAADTAPPAEGDTPPPEGEEPPAEEPPADEGGSYEAEPPAPSADVALECLARITRCLEALDKANDTSIVTPELAGIVNNATDSITSTLALEEPLAPATEADGPESRYATTKARAVDVLKKILAFIRDMFKKGMDWSKEFIAAYNARKGKYLPTAKGYGDRVKAIKTWPTVPELEVQLSGLSHNFNTNTADDIVKAAALNIKICQGISKLAAGLRPENVISIASLHTALKPSGGATSANLKFPKVEDVYRVSNASNGIVNDASITQAYQMPTPEAAGYFSISGLPGGRALNWGMGSVDGNPQFLENSVRQLSAFTFGVRNVDSKNQLCSITPDKHLIDNFIKVLNLTTGILEDATRDHSKIRGMQMSAVKAIEGMLVGLEKDPQIDSMYAQNVGRIATLWISALERCFVLPSAESVRAIDRSAQDLLRIIGNAVAAVEKALKGQDNAEGNNPAETPAA